MTVEETRQVALSLAGEMDRARVELLSGAIAEVRRRARRYVQEPSDTAWHDLVDGLTRTYGDMETYDLLRAVEIHSRTSRRRWTGLGLAMSGQLGALLLLLLLATTIIAFHWYFQHRRSEDDLRRFEGEHYQVARDRLSRLARRGRQPPASGRDEGSE
jgi:hypothetical protein